MYLSQKKLDVTELVVITETEANFEGVIHSYDDENATFNPVLQDGEHTFKVERFNGFVKNNEMDVPEFYKCLKVSCEIKRQGLEPENETYYLTDSYLILSLEASPTLPDYIKINVLKNHVDKVLAFSEPGKG